MDLFGVDGGYSDDLNPLLPPPKRPVKDFFPNAGSSLGVHGGQQGCQSIDLEAFDLNSQAPNFPRLTDMLLSSSVHCSRKAVDQGDRRGAGFSRSAMHAGPSVPARKALSADAPTKASKPFRAPRNVGASTRGTRARGSRRGTTTAVGLQDVQHKGLNDGSSHINVGAHGGLLGVAVSSGSARHPMLLPEGSASRATPPIGNSPSRIDSMPMVDDEGDHDVDEGGFNGSSAMLAACDDEGAMKFVLQEGQVMQQFGAIACMLGMYHYNTFSLKSRKRLSKLSGYEWVMTTLDNPTSCYNMFRMSRELFYRLHDVLVGSYGLNSTRRMNSVEALAMFLWIIGAPQSARQAENRFERSTETVSRKFKEVLQCVYHLSADIIKPKDPEFRIVHPRVRGARFAPYFDNCIGAIDGTHVPVVVPAAKVLQYVGRHGYSSQNILAICDFDMRFTFAVTGWPGSVHDTRVRTDALRKYGNKFPHPPLGKFYLVDSGYPNRPGYLAPYKGTKYHLPEFRQGVGPSGKKEVFNFIHSSLRNVIERSFGVLKMKWRIMLQLPSYPLAKQSKIILACMALHNFIRESAMADADFDMCDRDENYMPILAAAVSDRRGGSEHHGDEDHNMNVFRDNLADALFARRS